MCLFRIAAANELVQQGTLLANCGGRVFVLGSADSYSPTSNQGLKATLVDVHRGAERQVWLLRQQDDGTFLQEDISGSIALSAGRGPLSGLRGLDVNLSNFASEGVVDVARDPIAPAGQAGEINIGDRIAIERARRSAQATQN